MTIADTAPHAWDGQLSQTVMNVGAGFSPPQLSMIATGWRPSPR